jgi:hypothetical protein
VLAEYDALQIERVGKGMAQMLARVRAMEAREAEAREAALGSGAEQQRMHAQMQLTCEKLRRQLNRRTELLSHIAGTHPIAVAGLRKDDEALGRGSTITLPHADGHPAEPAEVERRYGSFRGTRPRCHYDEAEMMVQDQSLVPGDLRDIGRDVPSRPATVLCTRQGATEQQQLQQARRDARVRAQRTKLDLFRSCSDVEAAAVDLEADILAGLNDDAVES